MTDPARIRQALASMKFPQDHIFRMLNYVLYFTGKDAILIFLQHCTLVVRTGVRKCCMSVSSALLYTVAGVCSLN